MHQKQPPAKIALAIPSLFILIAPLSFSAAAALAATASTASKPNNRPITLFMASPFRRDGNAPSRT
jgi:hypothetical protein